MITPSSAARYAPASRLAIGTATDVGIIAMCTYIPRNAVSHEDLEVFDGVSAGKYTIGLGQSHMAFVTDREDVISLALTATSALLSGTNTPQNAVGRLEVGTETILDKSKSIKSALMTLFPDNGEIEGLDNTNACYGGTAALFNTAAWIESSAWDDRLGIVVCADVAVYAPGPARATGGAAATAMLLGRGEKVRLAFEVGLRATHMEHTYDFFKPDFSTEYPEVDGPATVSCFVRAMDKVYARFRERASAADGRRFEMHGSNVGYCLFHAPFNKMVRKALARLVWLDFAAQVERFKRKGVEMDPFFAPVMQWADWDGDYYNREAMNAFVALSRYVYEEKCAPGAWLARETGNSYTASLYSSLCALVTRDGERTHGKRILMFSFGSGLAASMFSLRVVGDVVGMADSLCIRNQLETREIVSPDEYLRWMNIREQDYNRFGYVPRDDVEKLGQGVYYLDSVTGNGARHYAKLNRGRNELTKEEKCGVNDGRTDCNGGSAHGKGLSKHEMEIKRNEG